MTGPSETFIGASERTMPSALGDTAALTKGNDRAARSRRSSGARDPNPIPQEGQPRQVHLPGDGEVRGWWMSLAEKHSLSLEATARDRTALVERDDEVPARRREDARLWLATVPVVLGAELRGYSAESRISAFSRSGGVP
jgi:hypothetical protein